MEGRNFAAGPWFTVTDTATDWLDFGTVWVSDGHIDAPATLQLKLALEPAPQDSHATH